jgi:hypothetical protein
MIVELSTENYPPTLKDLQSKISFIQWQFKIASFNSWLDACFWLLHVIKGVVSVWTIESGVECSQWLLRKQRITVLMK